MFRPLTSETRSPNRRGALLIAVLGLLTLFAIFALFFVFYADAEATGARIAREKESPGDVGPPDDYAQQAFNLTMRSILFDDFDIGGVLNPLRGHSLARSMYGFTGTAGASAPFSGLGFVASYLAFQLVTAGLLACALFVGHYKFSQNQCSS